MHFLSVLIRTYFRLVTCLKLDWVFVGLSRSQFYFFRGMARIMVSANVFDSIIARSTATTVVWRSWRSGMLGNNLNANASVCAFESCTNICPFSLSLSMLFFVLCVCVRLYLMLEMGRKLRAIIGNHCVQMKCVCSLILPFRCRYE